MGSITIKKNGRYSIAFDQSRDVITFAARWKSPQIPPAGVLTLSVDGDGGENNVKDLSSGNRCWECNMRPPFVDIDVTGWPNGAECEIEYN